MMTHRFAYIMRGIPGSGKSTTAYAIASQNGKLSPVLHDSVLKFYDDGKLYAVIHSTDSHFLSDGQYKFVPFKLGHYHQLNFQKFEASCDAETPIVICDNTNTTIKEFSKYLESARRRGYITAVIEMPHPSVEVAVERNLHSVPEEAIQKMLNRWEPYTGKKK
jgi:tRNA uridine 5-carbamoylmethylation protein Kti12